MTWQGINKRKFPRVSYKCLIRVREEGSENIIETFTENMGSGGICVSLEKKLGLFEKVGMKIFLEEGRGAVECRGTVVWAVRREPDKTIDKENYHVGIEFHDISREDRDRIERLVEDILEAEA